MNWQWEFILDIARNVALMGVGAYVSSRLPAIRRALTYSQYRLQDKIILAMVFGAFSAMGNYIGIPVVGALANTRIVGPIAGGLLGGPWVGLGAGILGAIPRYLIGGYTVPASVLANIMAGLISGFVYNKYGPSRLNLKIALMTALVCELNLKFLILLLSKPFEKAWELEKIIGIPTIIANSLAVGLFFYIVRDVFQEQQKVQAQSAQQAIRLIQKTTELLHEGLNTKTAFLIASILRTETKAAAVAITDNEKVLSFVGIGADHHQANAPILTRATQQAVNSRQTLIFNRQAEIGCPVPLCPLTSVIEAPLVVDGQVQGILKLYKANDEVITAYEAEIIQGIADFLGLLLDRHSLDEQKMMRAQAEYNMLKAQVNPHFLFNMLGTIRALVRTAPEQARARIKDLSDFLRCTLEHGADLARLAEELEIARSYVQLEQSRFGDRIQVREEVSESVLEYFLPVFSLQPLVENAIKHGLSSKRDGGTLVIRIYESESLLHMEVEDDGVGIPAARLQAIRQFDGTSSRDTTGAGIGLNNVHKRIQASFGPQYGLQIESREGKGTIVKALLPVLGKEG
ncbi:MAG TPA: LytS/YhcK type 5TM receptor domain-containing protein [Negativicutes bacterium]|nr:LytS/YhcK type 5TM receptor domain-containing protein [Negativicutes bacterium]